MTRNLKVLGLALVAVFALSAVAASGASAVTHVFQAEKAPVVITGEDNTQGQVFRSNGTESTPAVECNGKFSATGANKAEETITVTPSYTNCKPVLGNETFVDVNHCAYVFGGETDGSGLAPVTLECAEGGNIEVTIGKEGKACKLTFVEQKLNGAKYTNVGGGKEVEVSASVMNVQFTKTGPLCAGVPGNGTAGSYVGKVTVKGFEDKGTALTGTEKTTPSFTEGEGVGISTS